MNWKWGSNFVRTVATTTKAQCWTHILIFIFKENKLLSLHIPVTDIQQNFYPNLRRFMWINQYFQELTLYLLCSKQYQVYRIQSGSVTTSIRGFVFLAFGHIPEPIFREHLSSRVLFHKSEKQNDWQKCLICQSRFFFLFEMRKGKREAR